MWPEYQSAGSHPAAQLCSIQCIHTSVEFCRLRGTGQKILKEIRNARPSFLLSGRIVSPIIDIGMNIGTERRSAQYGGLPDRRGTTRFPVREEVRYRLVHTKSAKVSGTGVTLNIGSGGILFTTQERLPMGRTVEIAVNWPARLGGTCPLQFVATGRVVRSEADRAAVRIERYEFKTRSASASAGSVSAFGN